MSKAKREMWIQWVEEAKSVWDIARVARNPFYQKPRCVEIENRTGQVHSSDGDIVAAFIKHNLITKEKEEGGDERREEEKVRRRAPSQEAVRRTLKALKNKLVAGPEGIDRRLLQMLKGTALGRAVLEDVSLWASPEEGVKVPDTAREMTVVMIPKPGRDHGKVEGWRAIVLANTVEKLGEKLIAEDLQEIEGLWHERAFAGRGVGGSVMLLDLLRKRAGLRRSRKGHPLSLQLDRHNDHVQPVSDTCKHGLKTSSHQDRSR